MVPTSQTIRVFAPATVANLGVGFDILGLAVQGAGDTLVARRTEAPELRITSIEGIATPLPLDPAQNTATIAASAVFAKAKRSIGIEMSIHKGIPMGSGLGGSAASAAAGAYAANVLLGEVLTPFELIDCCLIAEAAVSGRHADNISAAILGGLVFVRSLDPLDVLHLPVPSDLWIAVVNPHFPLTSRHARSVLPATIPLSASVRASAQIGAFVAACYKGDLDLLRRCGEIDLVTQARASLIPGCLEIIENARSQGALLSAISGAGPSIFALTAGEAKAREIAETMISIFRKNDLASTALVSPAKGSGTRLLQGEGETWRSGG